MTVSCKKGQSDQVTANEGWFKMKNQKLLQKHIMVTLNVINF